MTDCKLTNLRAENKLLAEELEKHREAIRRLAEQDATLSLLCKRDGSCVVTVTIDGTLTRGERQALEFAIGAYSLDDSVPATLRGLLERTK